MHDDPQVAAKLKSGKEAASPPKPREEIRFAEAPAPFMVGELESEVGLQTGEVSKKQDELESLFAQMGLAI